MASTTIAVVEELQQLALAFNAKLQADATNQQREQQKAALLFAEVGGAPFQIWRPRSFL